MTKKRKRKRKINKKGYLLLAVILIGICYLGYTKTDHYQLSKIGYNKMEIQEIRKLNKKEVALIKTDTYDKEILSLLRNKEFKIKQFQNYYLYKKQHHTTIKETIFIVNHKLNERKEYDESKLKDYLYVKEKTNLNLEEVLKLVNDDLINETILSSFQKQKYYKEKNLKRYLTYFHQNIEFDPKDIIRNVNSNLDYAYYTNIQPVDLSKKNLIIVNKYYQLKEDYEPKDLVTIEDDFYATKETTDAYIKMKADAAKEGLSLAINSAYRSYATQQYLYQNYTNAHGQIWADSYSARPGHSEHQTGLALDITSNASNFDSFENTEEYQWLKKHSYKYGFILRYQEETEDITGYHYESWHYRYVGKEVAKKIVDENITYEEYFEYYVNK